MLLSNRSAISAKVKSVLLDEKTEVFISMANIWEMAIKTSIQKLTLNAPLKEIIHNAIETGGIQMLPIQLEHILGVQALPFHHRDPFDRILIAQAKQEGITIISGDKKFDHYGIDRIW
jgi:PIN domain nuclease of toxin-antitoxin system